MANSRKLSPAAQAVLLEAAGEGWEGMWRVAKVLHSRSLSPRWKGMTMDQVAAQPKQFSGMARTDKQAFLDAQPQSVIDQATKAVAQAPTQMSGKAWADHYVTNDLFKNPKRPDWVGKMKVVEQYGNHTFLKE